MRRALFMAMIVALAACRHDPAVDVLKELKDEACGCLDVPCADRVLKELAEKQDELRTSKQPDKARRLGEEVIDCLARAEEPPPPDAAPPDAVH